MPKTARAPNAARLISIGFCSSTHSRARPVPPPAPRTAKNKGFLAHEHVRTVPLGTRGVLRRRQKIRDDRGRSRKMTDCDVAVIGAGVIGEAVAHELVIRGASVTLLDCRGAGLGATQAAAGMLLRYFEGFGRAASSTRRAKSRACTMHSSIVSHVIQACASDITGRGSLQVATSDEHADELRQLAAELHRRESIVSCSTRVRLARAEPLLSQDVSCACLVKSHGFVVTSDLSGALTAAGIKRGMRVRVPGRVQRNLSRNADVEIALERDDRLGAPGRGCRRQLVRADRDRRRAAAAGKTGSRPALQLAWDGPPLQAHRLGIRAAIWCRPPRVPFWLARRLKRRASMSGPRWGASASCSMPRAISCPRSVRRRLSERAWACARRRRTRCRSSGARRRRGARVCDRALSQRRSPRAVDRARGCRSDPRKCEDPLMDAAAPERFGEY